MQAYVGILASCLILAACSGTDDPPDDVHRDPGRKPERLQLIEPGETYAGKSLEEWAVEYIRWSYSQTSCESAADDNDGSLCALYQNAEESPVFFLERSSLSESETIPLTKRTHCHVPSGKAILVPVAGIMVDNVGAPQADPDDVLEAAAQTIKDSLRDMILKVGGVSMEDADSRTVGPISLEYTLPAAPNYFTCSDMANVGDLVVKPSYFVGNLALFEPPNPGSYDIEYGSQHTYYNGEFGFHVKASITVDPADR